MRVLDPVAGRFLSLDPTDQLVSQYTPMRTGTRRSSGIRLET
jgi:hypothetical protein